MMISIRYYMSGFGPERPLARRGHAFPEENCYEPEFGEVTTESGSGRGRLG
jgi:hypothetical protein